MCGMFKIVGQPKAAARVVLQQGQKAQIRAEILSVNGPIPNIKNSLLVGPTDVTLASGPGPVIFNTENWIVNRQFSIANSGNTHIISAPGTVYRVDVPKDGVFLLTPSMLVGYAGVTPKTVFEQGRLDVVGAWLSWIREGLRSTYASFKSLVKIGGRYLRSSSSEIGQNEAPAWYSKDSSYTVYWHKVKTRSRSFWSKLNEVVFYATHAKKLQFEGPCSVLLKGKI